MSYAHDRTLLANLGFNDPDKKDPLHDLGCQYIALPRVCDAIGLMNGERKLLFDTTCRAHFEHPVSKGQNQYKTTIGFLDVVLPVRFEYDGYRTVATGKKLRFETREDAQIACERLRPGYDPEVHCVDMGVGEDQLQGLRSMLSDAATGRTKIPHREIGSPWWIETNKQLSAGIRPASYEINEYECVSLGKQWSSTEEIFVEVKIAPVGLGDVLRQINLYREYVGGTWVAAAAFEMSSAMVEGLRGAGVHPVHLGDGFRKWAAEQHAAPKAMDVQSI